MLKTNQTFILFTYGEMWLLKKISCEIQILNEKVWKLMIENGKLEKENKKLKEWNNELIENHKKDIAILCEENERLREELSKKSMDIWFDKKAENIFIDKSWKVIKGWEFTTLC